jgi:hypothetical protein
MPFSYGVSLPSFRIVTIACILLLGVATSLRNLLLVRQSKAAMNAQLWSGTFLRSPLTFSFGAELEIIGLSSNMLLNLPLSPVDSFLCAYFRFVDSLTTSFFLDS